MMNKNSEQPTDKKNACPCMEMNKKYAEGFVEKDPLVEEDITIEEEVSRN